MKALALLIFLFCGSVFLHAQTIISPNGATSPTYASTVAAVPSAYPSAAPLSYVRTWTLRKPVSDASQMTSSMPAGDVLMETHYLDGLGRPLQTVAKGVSPLGKDLVTPAVYDVFGREAFKYLPYVSGGSDGSFKANAFSEQASFMQSQYGGQGEQFFYGRTDYEASPLNRPLKSLAPGNSWVGSGRGVGISYEINDANEVRLWTIGPATGSFPSSSAYYGAGQLYRTVTTDEAGKRVVEYKAKDGIVVLKKVELVANAAIGSHTGWLCTYYVYDDLNNLRFVLSPKATETAIGSGTVSAAVADGLCFRYEYDYRNRLTTKKIPGAAEVWMIYDDRDRLVFSQDGNMRTKSQWLATVYDGLNRTVLTAMMVYTGSRSDLVNYAADPLHTTGASTVPLQSSGLSANLVLSSRQAGKTLYQATASIDFTPDFESEPAADFVAEIVNGQSASATLAVDGTPIPTAGVSSFTALTQNFYDDYSHTQKTYTATDNAKLEAGSNLYAESLPAAASAATRGLATGNKIWLMRSAGDLTDGEWLESTSFYDALAKPVQVQSDNHKGGLDVTSSRYNFSGKPLSTYQVHHNPQSATPEVRVLTLMDYDGQGRLLAVKKKLNDGAATKTTVQYEYDELGQLKTKHLGTGLQDLAYEYNIRGWLKSMNKDYVAGTSTSGRFGQTLSYDYGFNQSQYNGNIAGLQWRSMGDGEARAYGFAYDNVNRLLKADFTQYTSGWNNTAGVDFSMKMGDGIDPSTAYDANGNIRQMAQKGLLLQSSNWIDGLKYTYAEASNQLKNVVDLQNDPSTKLGDFRTSTLHPQKTLKDNEASNPGSVDLSTITDYNYDVNGNLNTDYNKDIAGAGGTNGIEYNHLNLPARITVQKQDGTKGTITYIYDAAGVKHQKVVKEYGVTVHYDNADHITNVTTITSYEGVFTYESRIYDAPTAASFNKVEQLQFFAHEEGRIRPTDNSSVPFVFDYMIKDHLGNVRMILTDEQRVDRYPVASLEASKIGSEENYYHIDESRVSPVSSMSNPPADYANDNGVGNTPSDPGFEASNSQRMYRLNGNSARTGLGITLKVMAGDRLDIFGKSYYTSSSDPDPVTPNRPTMTNEILQGLIGGAGSAVATAAHQAVTVGELSNLPGVAGGLGVLLGNQQILSASANKPQAFITYIFFDEQFKYAGGYFSAIGDAGTVRDHHTDLQNITVPKNGYVYIYCSNESPINVFFDNLQVMHTRGAELEEAHYYPFGLVMAGISSKASGSLKNKQKTFQGQYFDDDLNVNLIQFKWRNHDPQIGRFIEIDPLSDDYVYNSVYAFSENKVTSHVELEGLESKAISDRLWHQVQYEFQAAADWIDNTFTFGSKTTAETPVSKGGTKTTLTVETTKESHTNLGPAMGYIIRNNTNKGYNGEAVKTEKTITASVQQSVEVKAGVGTASASASVDQSGNKTVSGEATVSTRTGVDVGVNGSKSSSGQRTVGVSVSTTSGGTTVKAGVTGTANANGFQTVDLNFTIEQKVDKTKVSQTFFLSIGNH